MRTPTGVFAAGLIALLAMTAHPLLAQDSAELRSFAPGVLTTISPALAPEDTVSTHDLVEVRSDPALRWEPEYVTPSRTLYGMSEGVKFRRDVWGLEFSFKPLRMVHVDVPQPSGRMQRKLIWYLVYNVRNTGEILTPVEGDDGVVTAEPGRGGPVRFVPHFVLESHDRTPTGERVEKAYLDRVIPAAMEVIRRREARGQQLLNSAEIAELEIPVSDDRTDRSVWGVAMWTDVDPRIDFFSIYVGGLSNAYRWIDEPGAYRPGDPPGKGRRFARKTLQLNFWRPGDELSTDETAIRYGVPLGKAHLYDSPAGVAYQWVFR